jgi:hypothetical protein
MKKGFYCIFIMYLIISFVISFPVFGRSAWARERSNSSLTRGNVTLTLPASPSGYTKLDYSTPLPGSLQGLVDQFMNLAFVQSFMDWREQGKQRRAEWLGNWESFFNF